MNPDITFNTITQFQPFGLINGVLAILLVMLIVFSLLIFRQAVQMTQVLPTPLSPTVKVVVTGYIAVTIAALVLSLGVMLS